MGGPGSGRKKGNGPSKRGSISKGKNARENLTFAKQNKSKYPKLAGQTKKLKGKVKYLKKSGQDNMKA
jgi:hypothetical protein